MPRHWYVRPIPRERFDGVVATHRCLWGFARLFYLGLGIFALTVGFWIYDGAGRPLRDKNYEFNWRG